MQAAREFLAGKNDEPIALIEKQMLRAANNLQFEQAVVLREDLRAIEWLSRRVPGLQAAGRGE